MNSLFGALTVSLFFLFLRRLVPSRAVAAVFSLLLAFSYVFWYRSVDAQVYPPSLFWLLATLFLLLSYNRQQSTGKLLLLSITTGLAILAHQGNLFFIPAAAVGTALPSREKVRTILVFLLVATFLVVVPYLYVMVYQVRTFEDSNTGRLALNRQTVKDSFYWFLGNAGDYTPADNVYVNAYWQPRVKHLVTDFKVMMWAMWFGKGSYYSQYGRPSEMGRYGVLISKLLFLLLGIFFFIRGIIYRKYRALFVIALVWFLTYLAFVTWFNPGNPDYWYQHWMPILALLACALYEFLSDGSVRLGLRQAAAGLFFLSIAIVPVINFRDSIHPISKLENNEDYQKALFVGRYVKKGDCVILSGFGWNPGKVYLPTFTPAGRISLDMIFVQNPKPAALRKLKTELEMLASHGENLYALSEIFSKTSEEGLKNLNVSMGEIREIFEPYTFQIVGTFKDGMQILRVVPKPGTPAYDRREGIRCLNGKEYRKAIEYVLAIPEESKTAYDYKILGNCYLLENERGNAVASWKKGLALAPGDADLKSILEYYGAGK
jgi:hypothetical protein